MLRDTEYLSVFSPNAGKYGPEKTPYLDTFHVVLLVASAAYIWLLNRHFYLRNQINNRF